MFVLAVAGIGFVNLSYFGDQHVHLHSDKEVSQSIKRAVEKWKANAMTEDDQKKKIAELEDMRRRLEQELKLFSHDGNSASKVDAMSAGSLAALQRQRDALQREVAKLEGAGDTSVSSGGKPSSPTTTGPSPRNGGGRSASPSTAQPECGDCYGAGSEGECCQTCDDVRRAYRIRGWGFPPSKEQTVRQCVHIRQGDEECSPCYGAETFPDQCCNTCDVLMHTYRSKRWNLDEKKMKEIPVCRERYLQTHPNERGNLAAPSTSTQTTTDSKQRAEQHSKNQASGVARASNNQKQDDDEDAATKRLRGSSHPSPSPTTAVATSQKSKHGVFQGTVLPFEPVKCKDLDQRLCEIQTKFNRDLYALQYPTDCENPDRKFLHCDASKSCGFGCIFHHINYCLTIAVATGRTMILHSTPPSSKFRYADSNFCGNGKDNAGGYECYFKPLTSCTTNMMMSSVKGKFKKAHATAETAIASTDKHIRVDMVESSRQTWARYWTPDGLKEKLKGIHMHADTWVKGQLERFTFRPNAAMEKHLSKLSGALNFKKPCVGVHIRRTDKLISEAKLTPTHKYMDVVKEWFGNCTKTTGKKLDEQPVYIATDEPAVLSELRANYKNFHFIMNEDAAHGAQKGSTRYSYSSMQGLMADIHFLSQCDYFVGTFSSQISRIIYELFSYYRGDATFLVRSLDSVWYYG